ALIKDWTLEDLASDLGVSTRHLRRNFVQELGVTPIKYLQSIRLLRAKQLLGDSNLTVTQIAFASGFKSLRRFNEIFKQQYNLTPSNIRKQQSTKQSEDKTIHLKCGFRVPYDWSYIINYFHGRSAHAAELVRNSIYYRTVHMGDYKGWYAVSHSEKDLHLSIQISHSLHPIVSEIIPKIKRQFDVHANPLKINAKLEKDPILGPSISSHSGLRSPGSFDPFEMLVRVILGQRISVKAATTLMNRYVSTFGEVFETPIQGLDRISPLPEVVAQADAGKIASLGMPYKRAETIILVAKAFEQGKLDFAPDADIEKLKLGLADIPGIGPWTIEYMLMRGISWPDAFPTTDLGVQKALGTKSNKEIVATSDSWQPYRSYATHHLWKMLG
ncbi:MAG: helix-turn-helix domain-containing protein, partial [Cyclobacteriaceae bacterium]|nr:helix-turn-helix domain-containing protein [Cyclobacteriaceae bacterium HetDA_MAG_MS6]